MSFKDHFSGHASDYSRFRPAYPPELFTWLATQTSSPTRAWDCATGNGQAACALAPHFAEVIATDASSAQVENAQRCDGVRYAVATAENSGLNTASINLVTVAQALHWFDLERFYGEAQRVLKPGGIIAIWTYHLFRVSPEVDVIVDRLYRDTLGSYWPFELHHVEQGYRELPFPFQPIDAPPFHMTTRWSLDHVIGYLGTWSAVRRYHEDTGRDPVATLRDSLAGAWGALSERSVNWPLALRIGCT